MAKERGELKETLNDLSKVMLVGSGVWLLISGNYQALYFAAAGIGLYALTNK